MKYTIIILASFLLLSCHPILDPKVQKEQEDTSVKALYFIRVQFPKVNWFRSDCDYAADYIGTRECRIWAYGWYLPIRCTPEKCICEVCEQLK